MRRIAPWFLLLLGTGCYAPDLGPGRFACDSKDPVCPDGQRCVRGRCQAAEAGDGGGQGDSGGGQGDGGGAPCRQPGGFVVGRVRDRDIYACPGVFAANQAAQQCQGGYRLCESAEGIAPARCRGDGFFLSKLEGRWDEQARRVVCGNSTFMSYLVGCGLLPDGITMAECGGFTTALSCNRDNTFTCNGGPERAENREAKNGVLCCPP